MPELPGHERLLRLEQTTREQKIELTDDQMRHLERFGPELPLSSTQDMHLPTAGEEAS
ncbi:hypothetical protein FIU88_09675 [Halomonas sp. THAF12]|uniref:hypothetical protein n=1 Tax=Halomonas sp. THAF12 TaxID=2587849 RepID=UPI0012AA4C9F|nr:hypothetical protein [Halomonas sp. THAF12]QFT85245.1 hypothetical protein FIU88_09675 [Halomonas sp. THAF12]